MSEDFSHFLPMGKKLIEYYIYIRKLKDIEFTQTFNTSEIECWSVALLHFFNDMGTDENENALTEDEIRKQLTIEVPQMVV